MTDYHLLIPARLSSTRLPNKALADVCGLPLIARVWQTAIGADAKAVTVVTDHPEIQGAIEALGGHAIMTSADHVSGTDRLSEAAGLLGLADDAIVVNLQGDEPLMPKLCLQQVAQLLAAHPDAQMGTLYDELVSERQWRDPDVVKLVTDDQNQALCFSRSAIPHARQGDWPKTIAKRHVGLYAYRVSALKQWAALPVSQIEQSESLEQWRALSAGWTIVCGQASVSIPAGVDNLDDLARIQQVFNDPIHRAH